MYKIQSLEISNFKSYKSNYTIPFDDHFTCIIGPNGSGKSNILDAIVFVMTNKPYNIKNATVKLILKKENEKMTFTRFINNSGKNSYFINNKKTLYKEYIDNFIIYQSYTDLPISNIIEKASGSLQYKTEYDVLCRNYNNLLVKLKIETESRKQYLNIIKENKKYEEEYNKYIKMIDRKKIIEDLIFKYKISLLIKKYNNIKNKKENQGLINKKSLLNKSIKELNIKIDQRQDIINKIENDLKQEVNESIPNFEEMEKEYFRLLNDEKCYQVEVEDDISKNLLKEKDLLINKHKDSIEKYNESLNVLKKYNEELEEVNNEILLSKNIKSKSIKLYNLKSKVKNITGVIGFITDLVKCTNEKYEIAVKSLFYKFEYFVLVDTKETAFKCIKYCKDNKLGRITCIIKNKYKILKNKEHKDFINPLLVIKYQDDISDICKYLLGNIKISNKTYIEMTSSQNQYNLAFDICTIDGVILKNKGRLVNVYKHNASSASLERRMELLDKINILKKKIDMSHNIEIIQNKINKLSEDIENRKIIKMEVVAPETIAFGDIFKKYNYKNYNDYVTRNSKYYEEEKKLRDKVLIEKKNKLNEKQKEDLLNLEDLKNQYNNINIENSIEDEGIEKEDIEEEIKDLYFIEKNELININDVICPDDVINNNAINIDELRKELENINKCIKNASLMKITTEIDYNSELYDKLKKETLEVKMNLNTIKNKRISLFMEYLNNLNEIISNLYNKLSGGSCNLIADSSDEPFKNIKYYVMVPNKKYKEYESLSGGEQMISRVVFMYALNKLSNKGFILLDEVDANLDNYNILKLVEFIKSEDIQVIMVSLKADVYKESNRMIGIYKKSGISNILHYVF